MAELAHRDTMKTETQNNQLADGSPATAGFSRKYQWWAVTMLVLHGLAIAYTATRYSPTQDEVAHLPAGLAVWKFGRTDLYRVNPPLPRMVASFPLLFCEHEEDFRHYDPRYAYRQEWVVGADFIVANGENSFWLFTLARWAAMPFSLLGGWVCWRWGRELTNEFGGLTALFFWVISPNIIGHGSIITPDIPAVSCGLLAAWAYSRWLQNPTIERSFYAGTALGLALLTKLYWVTLLAWWPVLFILHRLLIPSRTHEDATGQAGKNVPSLWSCCSQLVVMLLLGLNILNFSYQYNDTLTPLGDYDFYSTALSGEERNPRVDKPGNRFRDGMFARIPVPFPRDYLTGIDIQKRDFERDNWSYLLGETKEKGGWWYYYIVGLAVKVPVGTWLISIVGLGLLCFGNARAWFLKTAPLTVPAIGIFVLASHETNMNRHVRYVFSMLPVLYLLAAQSAMFAFPSNQNAEGMKPLPSPSHGLMRWIFGLSAVMTFIASAVNFPHHLSFTNYAIGGPANGHKVIVDSNIDWGQDLIEVKKWLDANPEKRPIDIRWIGFYPIKKVGIDIAYTDRNPKPGWHIISVHKLHEPGEGSKPFLERDPVEKIGSTFHLYYIEDPSH